MLPGTVARPWTTADLFHDVHEFSFVFRPLVLHVAFARYQDWRFQETSGCEPHTPSNKGVGKVYKALDMCKAVEDPFWDSGYGQQKKYVSILTGVYLRQPREILDLGTRLDENITRIVV